jgi:hypothetical protein
MCEAIRRALRGEDKSGIIDIFIRSSGSETWVTKRNHDVKVQKAEREFQS